MRDGRFMSSLPAAIFLLAGGLTAWGQPTGGIVTARQGRTLPALRSADYAAQRAVVLDPATHNPVTLGLNQESGPWSLMAVIQSPRGSLAVFEDLGDWRGDMVFEGTDGSDLTLHQSAEPTTEMPSQMYEGHTLQEVASSRKDILSPDLLEGNGDPNYAAVAAAMPPLRVPSFVGTQESDDKPTYEYGGFSDEIYLDVGKLYPEIQKARQSRNVWEGLVGGWLPVLRFVFPTTPHRYWEETMFAAEGPGHFWTQPVWYRAIQVEDGKILQAHYFYHHLPFPPRGEPKASQFYQGLMKVQSVWAKQMDPPMKIDVPDPKILDFCLRSLSLQMITRVGNHPKYGYPPLGGINVFGGYGYNNVDTFQDTFNADVSAFLEWGMFDVAKGYIDDYFTNSVRDDGSIDTRGPEIGQYGKMLSVMAKYYDYTHDAQLMQKFQGKLNAIVDLFFSLRKQAKEVPTSDISYGIIRGWSEHDSSLKYNPFQYMLPHFSNNAEVARGFNDLGEAWISMGKVLSDTQLTSRGEELLREAAAMKSDMEKAIDKSVDQTQSPQYIPAVAGDTPTYGKERVYMELLESGMLTEQHAKMIMDNLAATGHSMFGLPRGGMHLTGFLAYGAAYSRLQFDLPRQFLLLYYADMSHIYSPGTWTSVESSKLDGTQGGPYCTPSEDTIPIFTKWMLIYEEPKDDVLWLAKATPRKWLSEGDKIAISGAPTRFGKVGFTLHSDIAHRKVSASIDLPPGYYATTKLRLRVPGGLVMRSVVVNGAKWTNFSAEQETVVLPGGQGQSVKVEVSY
jgi:hypothetical protein